jgi:subtilisin
MNKRLLSLVTVAAMIFAATPAIASGTHREFVVVLHPTDDVVPDVARQLASQHNGQVGFVYTTALQGFTISVPEPAAAALERNPNVAYVEPVHQVQTTGTQPIPTGIDRIEGDLNPPSVPMDVDIAILDTGVYIGQNPDGSSRSHLDLNLRFVSDCTGAIFYPLFGGCSGSGDFQDYHGHGTHVAGIAAAKDNDIGTLGVAPGATLWSFKVLQADGTGTTGMILAGIDAVAANADQIEVANMSLGFEGTSQAINDAIAAATNVGVTFVVAAGNSSIDASGFSPANSPGRDHGLGAGRFRRASRRTGFAHLSQRRGRHSRRLLQLRHGGGDRRPWCVHLLDLAERRVCDTVRNQHGQPLRRRGRGPLHRRERSAYQHPGRC